MKSFLKKGILALALSITLVDVIVAKFSITESFLEFLKNFVLLPINPVNVIAFEWHIFLDGIYLANELRFITH